MLRKIDRLVLRVPSLPGAVTYYRDVLGLRVVRQEQRAAVLRFADDSPELVLHNDPDAPAEAVYFLVDSVRQMYEKRRELRLQFSSPPVRVARGFRATVKDPFGTVMHLLDRSATGTDDRAASQDDHVEDAQPAAGLFAGVEHKVAAKKQTLIKLYEKLARTADDLPYTPHFESLYEPYVAHFADPKPTRAEVWRHLLNLRKAGKLPKLGEAKSKPPDVAPEARQRLREVLGDDIGKRDRLPYTPRFDQIADEFNKTLPRAQRLSPHLVWRLIATLAK
jgi:catechol 2,3-dioxygenase-like lactoylglutathione lyase family enzyme